ncbi:MULTISPECIES: dihydroneopterin aldolase [unclassified Gemella]|uniref:dihydroneopterin aldolase n=1 Tax=unclassified Gemella TaxID=2624949 RepID=UPI001C054B21|nr:MULTISPECIES: dihydroneopterin aldolase [unclassified Gemella]MBU0278081.1 dihydroneopterin aldolase [Gemella sp. zg-1178]QWQ38392.1 dihydroneopterin aldolase [Gemella sp. zg-570]
MKNSIYVKGIEVYAYHGVFKEENTLGQKFIFDIVCDLDYKKAMIDDLLEYSVSYADIVNTLTSVAVSNRYNLLEKLSYEIIKKIFLDYALINNIKLTVNKPNAPIDKKFNSCGAYIEMSREEFEVL